MQFDPNYLTNLTGAIRASSAQEQALTTELSSGLRVTTLSDDAVAASTNVGLSAAMSRIDAFVTSANSTQSRMQVADSALGEVVTQVTSAISLATSAGTGTLSTSNVQAIGQQVEAIRAQVLSLANTSYQGSYIFSGSKGDTEPFPLDTSTTPATVTYQGDSATSTLVTPDGQSIQTGLNGSSVFTASANLLQGLNQLVADLAAGNTSAMTADTAALTSGLAAVTTQRSTLDSGLSRVTAVSTYEQTQKANLSARQSTLLSADTADVATDLKTAETQHEAMLSVVSALDQTNLFSYLK